LGKPASMDLNPDEVRAFRESRRRSGVKVKRLPNDRIRDELVYSAFAESVLAAFLRDKNVDTLIITGSETDVCVLATVLEAVDLGFRVIVVEDALCSSFDEGHDALMTLYRNRFSEQVELMTQAHVSELWHER
jgi:nicotinamidase-related amidase